MRKKKSKTGRILLVLIVGLVVAYMVIPEVEIKQTSKDSVEYLAKEMGYPPAVCNFLVNTKVGRKLSYIGLKREVKRELRHAKREMKQMLK